MNGMPAVLPQVNSYGVFFGEINPQSAQIFASRLAFATQDKSADKHLHLLFQSGGGTIAEGIALYNLISTSPIDISLYNMGSLQSMATIVFLAAKRRVVNQHGTFMLHAPTCAPQPMTTNRLTDVLESLKIDDARTNAILRRHLKMSETQWTNLRHNEFWITAADSVKNGIATEIGDFTPPRGSPLISFNCL